MSASFIGIAIVFTTVATFTMVLIVAIKLVSSVVYFLLIKADLV